MLPRDPEPPRTDPAAATPVAPIPPAPQPGASLEVPPTPVLPRASAARTPILVGALIVVAILAGGTLFLSGVFVGQRFAHQPGTPVAAEDQFQPFWDTYDAILKRYALGGVDEKSLVQGAIKGMVDSLGDPYSTYLTPDQYREGLQDLSGQFEGIGAEIGTHNAKGETSDCTTLGPDCILVVVSPLDGSPAEKAGIQAGDEITAVDGASVDGLTVDGARDKVRGKKGTQVTLTIVRGKAAPIDITVTRDVIISKEVITKTLGGGAVGYIAVTAFSDSSAGKFQDALQSDLKAGET